MGGKEGGGPREKKRKDAGAVDGGKQGGPSLTGGEKGTGLRAAKGKGNVAAVARGKGNTVVAARGKDNVAVAARGKAGTLMVESALIFPLVVLGLLTVLYIMILLYSETVALATLHGEARAGAGLAGGTVSRGAEAVERPGLYLPGAHGREAAEEAARSAGEALESYPLSITVLAVEGRYQGGLLRPQLHLSAELEAGPWGLLERGKEKSLATWAGVPGEAALARRGDLLAEGLATLRELSEDEE